jgi:hypothetical protein
MEFTMPLARLYEKVFVKHDQTSMHTRSVPCHSKGGNLVVSPSLYWVGWCISSAPDSYLRGARPKSQPGHWLSWL